MDGETSCNVSVDSSLVTFRAICTNISSTMIVSSLPVVGACVIVRLILRAICGALPAAALLTHSCRLDPCWLDRAPLGSPGRDEVRRRHPMATWVLPRCGFVVGECSAGPRRVVAVTLEQGLIDLAIVSLIAAMTPILAGLLSRFRCRRWSF